MVEGESNGDVGADADELERIPLCGLMMDANRRKFLGGTGAGFTGLALASMLAEQGILTGGRAFGLEGEGDRALGAASALGAEVVAKAKYCIFLYM